jgi:hypothetical protein
MRLNVKGLAIASGLVWAGCVFCVGLAHLIWPGYGGAFLELASSIYPGYMIGGFGSVIVGALYAFLDGAFGGAVFAWLYNAFSGPGGSTA